MKKFVRNQSGSFTVEAALVMSAVIIVLSFFILAFMLMYHKVLLTRTVIKTAREGACFWADGNQGLYYRISESFLSDEMKSITLINNYISEIRGEKDKKNPTENKLRLIADCADNELDRGIINPIQNIVNIAYGNLFGFREIVVEMEQEIRIPLGGIKSLLSGNETFKIHSVGKSVIAEPAEYIRNLDLVLELAGRYDSISKGLSVLKDETK